MSLSKAPRVRQPAPPCFRVSSMSWARCWHRALLAGCKRWRNHRLKVSVMLMALSLVVIRIQSSRKLEISLPMVPTYSSSLSSSSHTKADDVPSVSLLVSSWGSVWAAPIFWSRSRVPDSALRGRAGSSLSSPSTPTGDSGASNYHSTYNLHAHYPMVCDDDDSAQQRDWRIHPSVPSYLDLIKNNREANTREHKQEFTVVGHFASGSSPKQLNELARLQSCTYSLLNDWNQLAQRHSIQPWAAHGGSAIGAKCFGSMNPWDDDIDISIWDCSALDRLWENGRLVNETYPDLNPEEYRVDKPHQSFEPRLIENDLILLKGGRCCHWYKLKSVAQVRHKIKAGSDIVGLDLECMSQTTFENKVRKDAGWDAHMSNETTSHKLDTVMFGPTTIQVTPQPMLDRYIEYRYGKKDPCSFPFRSGQDPIAGLLRTNHTDHRPDDTKGLFRYAPVIRAHQMHWVMANWYTSKVQRGMWLRRASLGSNENKKDEIYWQRQSILSAMNRVEVDSTISMAPCHLGSFDPQPNRTMFQVLAFNAERGTHWDEWSELIRASDSFSQSDVLVVSNVDVGMARSGNVHTVRRLALAMGMNYAFAVEAVELTRGNREEQEATHGQRDALGLNGHAILCKCRITDPVVVRDKLVDFDQLSLQSGEKRLGGRATLFVRVLGDGDIEGSTGIVVGNAPQLSPGEHASVKSMDYIGKSSAVVIAGAGDSSRVCQELGLKVVVNGQESASGCGLFGIPRLYPSSLCSNLHPTFRLAVSPCFGDSLLGASALSSHAMATATLALED